MTNPQLIAGVMATAILACASTAFADKETVLFCQGPQNVNGIARLPESKYYKVGTGYFDLWEKGQVKWFGNLCDNVGSTCQSGLTYYIMTTDLKKGDGSRLSRTIQINRQTGTVDDTMLNGADTVNFQGNCRIAPDPAVPTGPNRF